MVSPTQGGHTGQSRTTQWSVLVNRGQRLSWAINKYSGQSTLTPADTDLGLEGLARLEHVQQLRVVYLEQHAGDLASELRVHLLDEREEAFTQHLLLFLGWGGGQHAGGERGLAGDHHGLRGHLQQQQHITWVTNKTSVYQDNVWSGTRLMCAEKLCTTFSNCNHAVLRTVSNCSHFIQSHYHCDS